MCLASALWFSPRPWGWSGQHLDNRANRGVFPTPVGMVRDRQRRLGRRCGFPHARGDGPTLMIFMRGGIVFSPRPWGWSRPHGRPSPHTPCFPHARGDGPKRALNWRCFLAFSPRPWGWSANLSHDGDCFVVFPTPVGMVHTASLGILTASCFPHARGDGPYEFTGETYVYQFSPRPWGWS